MTRKYRAVCCVAAIAISGSCAPKQQDFDSLPAPIVIGQVNDEQPGGQICKDSNCVDASGQVILSGDGLKSAVAAQLRFDLYGAKGQQSSHKLLGQVGQIDRSEDNPQINLLLEDGTLTGEIVDQPVRITFGRIQNGKEKTVYCEFSNGKYRAVNDILNILELSGGEAICFDRDGHEHTITTNKFSV